MTPIALETFRADMGWDRKRLGAELDISQDRLRRFLSGAVSIPRHIALACEALAGRLPLPPLDQDCRTFVEIDRRRFLVDEASGAVWQLRGDTDRMTPIKVASAEEAETADFVVCALEGTPTPFVDNHKGSCAHCGRAIIFRPYVPERPPKICIDCALSFAAAARH